MGPTRKLALAAGSALVGMALVLSISRGQDEKPAEPTDPGLRGILIEDVPLDLTSDAIIIPNPKWETWASQLAETIQQLYSGENVDKAAQVELLGKLKKRLAAIDEALADPKYKSLFDSLTSLRGRLARRIDFATAALDTLDQDPAQIHTAQLEAAGKKVTAAIEALQKEMQPVSTGANWLKYVRADELTTLAKGPADTEKAVPVFQAIKDKLAARETLKVEAQKKFLSRPGFVGLEKALNEYLTAAAQPPKTVDVAALRDALGKLGHAIEAYEETGLSADGAKIQESLAAVSKLAADDGRKISAAVRLHYFNSNLHLLASEAFLSRLVQENRTESGAIVDAVPGANVRGNQTTTTSVSVDLKPSTNGGLFNLTLSGRTQSNTSSFASQAVIYSTGDHQFWAVKPVRFDGYKLKTGKASISVNPNVYNYSATVYGYESGLFSGTARRRALGAANGRLGEAREHARQRVTENVLPRFEKESEKSMHDADDRLQNGLQKRLKEANVYPERVVVATGESAMRLQSTVKNDGELGGDTSPAAFKIGNDALIEIHESLLNNVLSRMNFAGKTMTNDDVVKEVERFLTIVNGKEVKLETKDAKKSEEEPAADEPRAFIFADKDPIRVEFEDGLVKLIIRAGFEQPGKENIPTQQVTVPLIYKVEGKQIAVSVEPNTVQVTPVDKPESTAKQLGFAGVIKKKIEKSIPNRKRDATVNFEREKKPPVVLNVTDLNAVGGWLIVRLR